MATSIVIVLTGFIGVGALLILIGTAFNTYHGGSGNGYLLGGALCIIAAFILGLITALSHSDGGDI